MNQEQIQQMLESLRQLALAPPVLDSRPKTLSDIDPDKWRQWRTEFEALVLKNRWSNSRAKREAAAAMEGDMSDAVADIPYHHEEQSLYALLEAYQQRVIPLTGIARAAWLKANGWQTEEPPTGANANRVPPILSLRGPSAATQGWPSAPTVPTAERSPVRPPGNTREEIQEAGQLPFQAVATSSECGGTAVAAATASVAPRPSSPLLKKQRVARRPPPQRPRKVSKPDRPKAPLPRTPTARCWQCDVEGHGWTDCPQRRLFMRPAQQPLIRNRARYVAESAMALAHSRDRRGACQCVHTCQTNCACFHYCPNN